MVCGVADPDVIGLYQSGRTEVEDRHNTTNLVISSPLSRRSCLSRPYLGNENPDAMVQSNLVRLKLVHRSGVMGWSTISPPGVPAWSAHPSIRTARPQVRTRTHGQPRLRSGARTSQGTVPAPGVTSVRASKPLFSPRFYSAWTRTLETCIRLMAGVELLTWVCQLAVCGDAMLLDKIMK